MTDASSSRWQPLAMPVAIVGWILLFATVSVVIPLSTISQVILGVVWLLGLILLSRKYLISLYGPVMAYDFLRVGRKPRVIWFRLAYAITMAVVFTWIYLTGIYLSERYAGTTIQTKELARIAEAFFETFMVIQFILVCVLTPASVAGAIADEKERRTLEFLLATDLRDREILFGKLASRVGSLLLFLAAGLPVLGMIQFFGGIDPNMVIAGFIATLMTILSLAALGIAASVMSRKARDAIALTYLGAVSYIVLSLVLYGLAHAPVVRGAVNVFGYTITMVDCAYPIVAGNPFFQVVELQQSSRFASPGNVYQNVRDYTLFHTLWIVLCVSWAAWKLRAIALNQLFGSKRSFFRKAPKPPPAAEKKPKAAAPTPAFGILFQRPDIGSSPIVWKEIFVDSGLRLGMFAKIVIWCLIALSFFPLGIIIWDSWFTFSGYRSNSFSHRWDRMADEMNAFARGVGTVVASMLFLAVAIRGAGSVSGERDRHTLDVLFTTPLSASRILWGKWWGCLLGMRWGFAWLFIVWFVSLALGGLHPVMVLPILASTFIYAAGFAWIGIFCSLYLGTTLKASIAAIFISVMLGGGYFLIFVFCCMIPLSFAGGPGNRDIEVVIDALCSISPPVNLAWLPISEFESRELSLTSRDVPYTPFWLLGLIAWGVLSMALARVCMDKFRKLANRVPMTPPKRRDHSSML